MHFCINTNYNTSFDNKLTAQISENELHGSDGTDNAKVEDRKAHGSQMAGTRTSIEDSLS